MLQFSASFPDFANLNSSHTRAELNPFMTQLCLHVCVNNSTFSSLCMQATFSHSSELPHNEIASLQTVTTLMLHTTVEGIEL